MLVELTDTMSQLPDIHDESRPTPFNTSYMFFFHLLLFLFAGISHICVVFNIAECGISWNLFDA